MDSEELLAQLADIHLPEPISSWPPALGWWILALIIFTLVVLGLRKYARGQRRLRIRQFALVELEKCYRSYANSGSEDLNELKLRYVNQLNSVLRRVALYHYPDAKVASLSGEAWLDFLTQSGDSSLISDEISASLIHGRFQTRCDINIELMHEFAKKWLLSLYRQGPRNETNREETGGLSANA